MFFTYLNFWEGKTVDDLWKKLNADLKTAVMGSWACVRARAIARSRAGPFLSEASARARRGCRYWVPAHTVNFKFIPGEQRLLYINVMQIMCATSARDARVGAPAP